MSRKQRNRLVVVIAASIMVAVVLFLVRITMVCCVLPPTPPTLTAQSIRTTASLMVSLNQTTEAHLHETETYAVRGGVQGTMTPSSTASYPYDPTLYAQRRHEEQLLQTAAGPDDYATFYAEETALVATYQGTISPPFTPIPYDAGMSPTAPLLPSRTPTLCPPSDVICPGGNATMSPADQVMALMASAGAPEFGQLAQTATALYVTLTPSPSPSPASSAHDSTCVFNWARQELPEIAQAAHEALSVISIARFQVLRVEAYGENCYKTDGSVSYFAAMTTDFYLSVEVADLNDAHQLAQIAKVAYTFLTELKVELPAPAGYLDIVLTAGEQQKRFRAMFSAIKAALEAGKTGAALLDATGGLR